MKLKKNLTFIDIFCLASGAMISSGIFILPGIAFAKTGSSVIISYALAGIMAFIGVLSVIELTTAMPKAGGDYYFISRGLGPFIGLNAGFFSWVALSLKSAFAIFGLSELIHLFFGVPLFLAGIFITLFFVLINIWGVKSASRFQVVLVLVLLIALGLYILFGFSHVSPSNFSPFIIRGVNGVVSTAAFVFISFGGLMKIASIAEEVDKPKRNLPLGLIISVTSMTIIYMLLLYVTIGILPTADLSNSLNPLSDASSVFLGYPGLIVMSILAALAFITTANAGILAASRYPLALSKDNYLPKFISYISKMRKTPIVAIVLTGFLIISTLTFDLETLAKIGSSVILFSYLLASLSVIVFRHSKLKNYQPSFKTPLYPLPQLIGIFGFTFMIVDLGVTALETTLALIILSSFIYFAYGHRQAKRYALQHLTERVTGNSSSPELEKELKKVLKERDANFLKRFFSWLKSKL